MATTYVDVAAVRMLRDGLQAAVRRLAEPHDRPVIREDRTLTAHQVPGLVQQLRDAIPTGGETGRATARSGSHAPPISVAALDKLTEIERGVAQLHVEVLALAYARMPPEHRLRAIAELTIGWSDIEALAWVLRAVTRWTDDIVALLDPPHRLHLAGACPRCEARMIWHRDHTTGQDVQIPALAVNLVDGAKCGACGHTWTANPNQLDHLARVLRQQDADTAQARKASKPLTSPATEVSIPAPREEATPGYPGPDRTRRAAANPRIDIPPGHESY